jgi:UDP-3-O-[3-hydroxymyristoyl] N-acetylglucosamine deacetylase/3-hydroxyacyl-[acyl-carrier-protein] dehydratase
VLEIRTTTAVALKNVTINEPFSSTTRYPVMPGVLQTVLAQAAGILMLRKISGEGRTALFMSCDKAKFRRAVRPGDQLVVSVRITKNRGNTIAVAEGTCTVNGQTVSSCELMFGVVDNAEVE